MASTPSISADYIDGQYTRWILRSSRHHFAEGVLESLHLFGEADRDSHVRGPHRPASPDIDLFGLQREDDFPDGALHVDHEAVRFAGHVAEVVLLQEAVGFLAHVADKLAPFR